MGGVSVRKKEGRWQDVCNNNGREDLLRRHNNTNSHRTRLHSGYKKEAVKIMSQVPTLPLRRIPCFSPPQTDFRRYGFGLANIMIRDQVGQRGADDVRERE